MEITLEQVERLREKANVSYARAKQALEYSGGNLLDALIYLEEQGDIPRPEGAYYSTRSQTPPPPREEPEEIQPGKSTGKKAAGKLSEERRSPASLCLLLQIFQYNLLKKGIDERLIL